LTNDREAARKAARERLIQHHNLEWQQRVAQQKQQITVSEEYEKFLKEEIEKRTRELNTFSHDFMDLEAIQEDLTRQEELSKRAAASLQAVQVEMQAPSRTSLLEEAVLTQVGGPSRVVKFVALPSLAVFFGLIVGVAWIEARTGRISRSDQVSQQLGINPVGLLPDVPDWPRGFVDSAAIGAEDEFTDAVDATCAMLLRNTDTSASQVLLTASAQSGEGKSTLSCQLALGFARAGFKTLLIDGDLRNASLHRVFGVPAEPGFADVLRGAADYSAALRPGPADRLTLLPSGRCDARTVRGLDWKRLPDLFRQFRGEYQIVVIDTAPLLALPDTLYLAEHADGAVLALRRDVSRLAAAWAATQRLSMFKCRLVGAIVSGEKLSEYGTYNPSRRAAADPERPPAGPMPAAADDEVNLG
jgi:succinoglycan biosynthesis transport protein ExoP